jgi:hypothetical protein
MGVLAPAIGTEALDWMDVGTPPQSVLDWRAAMDKKAVRVTGVIVGAMSGGLAGFAGVATLGGSSSSPLTSSPAIFLGIGIPVGLGFYLLLRWAQPKSKAAKLWVALRVAIAGGLLYVDFSDGERLRWRLKDVTVSNVSPAGGWFVVGHRGGGSFWAPPGVAALIRSSATH